ncbi:MAG: replication-relaxation family protein [Elusimicrobia bacterium]|nr:replication-relaxation family protein [Elusimicrobiota bacterium]
MDENVEALKEEDGELEKEKGLDLAGDGDQKEKGQGDSEVKDGQAVEVSGTLTLKMINLMAVIAEHDFLTINEVGMVYSNQSHAYKVLSQLKGQGFIRTFYTNWRPKQAYCLTPQGYKLLAGEGKLRIKSRFDPNQYKATVFNHQVACAQARLILAQSPLMTNYFSEGMIWENYPNAKKVCDGMLRFKKTPEEKGLVVGVEVELTLKSADRLKEAFDELRWSRELDAVWYICKDQGLFQSLRRVLLGGYLPEAPFFFFMTLEDLKAGKKALIDIHGNSYSLDPANLTWPPVTPKEESKQEEPGVNDGQDHQEGHATEPVQTVTVSGQDGLRPQAIDAIIPSVNVKEELVALRALFFQAIKRNAPRYLNPRFLADCWAQITIIASCCWLLMRIEHRAQPLRRSEACLERIFDRAKNKAAARALWIDAVLGCANQKSSQNFQDGDCR